MEENVQIHPKIKCSRSTNFTFWIDHDLYGCKVVACKLRAHSLREIISHLIVLGLDERPLKTHLSSTGSGLEASFISWSKFEVTLCLWLPSIYFIALVICWVYTSVRFLPRILTVVCMSDTSHSSYSFCVYDKLIDVRPIVSLFWFLLMRGFGIIWLAVLWVFPPPLQVLRRFTWVLGINLKEGLNYS